MATEQPLAWDANVPLVIKVSTEANEFVVQRYQVTANGILATVKVPGATVMRFVPYSQLTYLQQTIPDPS